MREERGGEDRSEGGEGRGGVREGRGWEGRSEGGLRRD